MKINFLKKSKVKFVQYRPDLYNDYDKDRANAIFSVPDVNTITSHTFKRNGQYMPSICQGTYEFNYRGRTFFASILGLYAAYDCSNDYAIWTYMNNRGGKYSVLRCLNMHQSNSVIMKEIREAYERKDHNKVGKLIVPILTSAIRNKVMLI